MITQEISQAEILERIDATIDTFFDDASHLKQFVESDQSMEDKLMIILSESMQALAFVTALEDEFDLEFDDDEIDLEFFSDRQVIAERVGERINNKI